ncbi:MAG TPA: dipeptidase [Bacteroidota bacterium]
MTFNRSVPFFLVVGLAAATSVVVEARESASSSESTGSQGQAEGYLRFHYGSLVADTHNDVLLRVIHGEDITHRTVRGQSDLDRMKEGGVDVQVFSVWIAPGYIPHAYERANEEIDSLESIVHRASGRIGIARTPMEVDALVREGKIAALIGVEGGHHIENDTGKFEALCRRGMRSMTLTWNNSTEWATSANDETLRADSLPHKGLTEFGRSIVRRMNELGIMVDVSHVGEQTFWDVLRTTTKPVIASHSSCYAICPHYRNLKDDQLKAIAENGGVVFINFFSGFLDSTYSRKHRAITGRYRTRLDSLKNAWKGDDFGLDGAESELLRPDMEKIRPPLSLLVDHIDHAVKVAGIDHVGLGSDFDGISSSPVGMEDAAQFPNITRELLKRGYSREDVRKVLGENFMRVFREVTQ